MKPRKASREMSRPAAVAFSGGSGSGRAGTRRDSSDDVLIETGISTTPTQRFGRISPHLTGQAHGEKIGLDEVYHALAQRFRRVRLAVPPPVRNLSFQELTPVDCGTLGDPGDDLKHLVALVKALVRALVKALVNAPGHTDRCGCGGCSVIAAC